jgi:hypothetical protein
MKAMASPVARHQYGCSPGPASEPEEEPVQSVSAPRAVARGRGWLSAVARISFVTGALLLALEVAVIAPVL